MNNLNIGIFSNSDTADAAVRELTIAGFDPKEISIVAGEKVRNRYVTQDPAESAVEGSVAGATLGGLSGLLLGLMAVSVPGIGMLFVGGPLATALGITGVAATTVSGTLTGALAGGILGALIGLGIPEEKAKYYEESLTNGSVLLAVPSKMAKDRDESLEIMKANGADQVETIATKINL